MLAAAAVSGGMGGMGGAALRRGMKMLGSTEALQKVAPQLGDIADTVRGDLLTAGKAAATAAVNNRVESLTDSLHQRAEQARNPAAAAAGAGAAARGGAASAVRGVRRTGRPSAGGEEAGGEEAGGEEAGQPATGGEDAGQPRDEDWRSGAPDDGGRDEAPQREAAGPAGESRPPRRPRRTTTTQRRAPVTRARR